MALTSRTLGLIVGVMGESCWRTGCGIRVVEGLLATHFPLVPLSPLGPGGSLMSTVF